MKICFITDTIFMHGGVARVTTNISNFLQGYGYQVDIINTLICDEKKVYELDNRIRVINHSINVNKLNKFLGNIIYFAGVEETNIGGKLNCKIRNYSNEIKQLIKLLNENEYDVVIGVHYKYTMLLASISDKIIAKTISWQHNSYEAYVGTKRNYLWRKKGAFKYALSKIDLNFVLTESDKKKYNDYFDANTIVMNNPNSFNNNKISKLVNKKFIAVGRLVEQKGFDILIEAFGEFSKYNDDWTLDIIGEGDLKESLQAQIHKNELEGRVRIKPFTENIKREYTDSTVFVLSSRYEGWGLVWIEAMLSGLPIVCFNLNACKEVIGKEDVGIIVDYINSEDLARGMLSIISDNERLNIRSKNAIKLAKKFSIENIGQKWVDCIGGLLKDE